MLFLIPSDERNKLQSKSLECIFLGFEKGVKGFKLYDMANKKKILSRDVVFDEASMSKEEAKDDGKRGVVTEIPITTKISDNGIDEVQQEVILEEPRSIAQESQGESQSHRSGTVGMMRLMKCILHSWLVREIQLHLMKQLVIMIKKVG